MADEVASSSLGTGPNPVSVKRKKKYNLSRAEILEELFSNPDLDSDSPNEELQVDEVSDIEEEPEIVMLL